MLSVSFNLALVAAMLFGIVLPGHHKEVDKFNGQTREPILAGSLYLVNWLQQFKVVNKKFSHRGRCTQKRAKSSHTLGVSGAVILAERFSSCWPKSCCSVV